MDYQIERGMAEIKMILGMIDSVYIEKLPREFIDRINQFDASKYHCNIDPSKPLREQNLSSFTINILDSLFYNYWSISQKDNIMAMALEKVRKSKKQSAEEISTYRNVIGRIETSGIDETKTISDIRRMLRDFYIEKTREIRHKLVELYGEDYTKENGLPEVPRLSFYDQMGVVTHVSGEYRGSKKEIRLNTYDLRVALKSKKNEKAIQATDELYRTLSHELEHYYQDLLTALDTCSYENMRCVRDDIVFKYMSNFYNNNYNTYLNGVKEVLARKSEERNTASAIGKRKRKKIRFPYQNYRPLLSNRIYSSVYSWSGENVNLKENFQDIRNFLHHRLDDSDEVTYKIVDRAVKSEGGEVYLEAYPILKRFYKVEDGKVVSKGPAELYIEMQDNSTMIKSCREDKIHNPEKVKLVKENRLMYTELLSRSLIDNGDDIEELIKEIGKEETYRILRDIHSFLNYQLTIKLNEISKYYQALNKKQNYAENRDRKVITRTYQEKMLRLGHLMSRIAMYGDVNAKKSKIYLRDIAEVIPNANLLPIPDDIDSEDIVIE